MKKTPACASGDIDNQSNSSNYTYDDIGNLIGDVAENIASIEWNVYGKIRKIIRTQGSLKPDLEFEYTPDGHRAVKIVIPKTTGSRNTYTYYVRDAQGNVMATYTRQYERTIDFDNITYAQAKDELISLAGLQSFADFITNLHGGNVSGMNDALETAVNANSTLQQNFLTNINPYTLLSHNNNATLSDNTIINLSNNDFLDYIFNSYTPSGLDLCNCATARNTQNSSYPTILENIVGNSSKREEFFTWMYYNDNGNFNSIMSALSFSQPNDLNASLSDLTSEIGTNGISNVMTELNTNGNYTSCSIFGGVLEQLCSSPVQWKNLIVDMSQPKELLYETGAGSVSFSCTKLDKNGVLSYICTGNTAATWASAISQATNGASTLIGFYKANEKPTFLYNAVLQAPATLSTYQQNNTSLYNSTGNGVKEYFGHIRDYYGQAIYDQLANHFLNVSTLYIDSLNVDEWHIYGSSRLGVYDAGFNIAYRRIRITQNGGVETETQDGNAINSILSLIPMRLND